MCLGGGSPPKKEIPIYQYDLKGKYLRKFPSTKSAVEFCNNSGICCALKYKTICGGYLWSYNKVKHLNISKYKIVVQKVPIYTYNNQGHFLTSYESLSAFCEIFKVSLGPVQRAIKTKTKIKGQYLSREKLTKFIKPIKTKRSSTIYQYNLNGTFIRSWASIKEVVTNLGTEYKKLRNNLYLGNIRCGEFQWSRKKVNSLLPIQSYKRCKEVVQLDLNGNVIKIWNSVRDCRKVFGNVSRVLSGKVKQCKGYTFKYNS